MDDEDARTIWCGNLSEKVTEEILYELFLQAGPVQRVSIPKAKDGRQKTFAFITYKHECSVPYALALFEGTELFKREMNLQSRNNSRIDVQLLKGPESTHNRSQSLPINFGASLNVPAAININALPSLLMGQGLFIDHHIMNPAADLGRLYASQAGVSRYLGGANKFADLSARSLRGNWSSRSHPYAYSSHYRSHGDRSRRH